MSKATPHPSLFAGTPFEPAIRAAWIQASKFHDLTEDEVLREVARRVSDVKAKARGQAREAHPLVLLDLDSTLYEVGPRTHQILREWVEASESHAYPLVRKAMEVLEARHVGYSLRDTFLSLGLAMESDEVKGAWESAKKFWAARFFSSPYLKYDHAYPGAAEFTRHVYELGAEVVYLTGRDEPNMGDGTRQCLLRDGFPWEVPRTHLLLKAAAHLPDLAHKQEAAVYVRQHGTLIASFENEPPNLVALHDLFPEAMHVFVETVCSDHPAMPGRGLYRIRGFNSNAQ